MLKKIYVFYVMLILLFPPVVFAKQDNSIVHGPFNISWCNEGKFYFEESIDLDYPINFILKCGNITKVIDKYLADGASIINFSGKSKTNMDIESVFFQKIKLKKYLFVIVRRGIIHRALGINGDDYKIYAYKYDPKYIIQLDDGLMNDHNFNGFDGELDGEESYFKYKTAAEVKKYINETYNQKK